MGRATSENIVLHWDVVEVETCGVLVELVVGWAGVGGLGEFLSYWQISLMI